MKIRFSDLMVFWLFLFGAFLGGTIAVAIALSDPASAYNWQDSLWVLTGASFVIYAMLWYYKRDRERESGEEFA